MSTSSISRPRLLAGLAATAIAAELLPMRPAGAADHLRLGILNFDPSTPACYAQGAGLFADAGLDVSLQVLGSGAAVAAAVVGGSVDFGLSSLFALLSAHSHGVPLKMVAGAANFDRAYPPVTGVLVKNDSPLQRNVDLAGKIVSVAALQDEMVVNMRCWIDQSGGHSNAIQFVEVTGPGVGPALDSGRIDAAAIGNPLFANLMATGKYRTIGNPSVGMAAHYLTVGWIAMNDFVKANPSLVKTFVGVMTKACAFANAHPTETAPMLAKYTGIDPALIARIPRSHYQANLDARDMQPVIDASAKYGIIPASFPARDLIA